MQLPFSLTEESVKLRAAEKVYRRGESIFNEGAVESVFLRGDLLVGRVQEQRSPQYRVEITFKDEAILKTKCHCTSPWPECEHTVATLLFCLHMPHEIELKPSIDVLLRQASHETLCQVWEEFLGILPQHLEWLDSQLTTYIANQEPVLDVASLPVFSHGPTAQEKSEPVEEEVVEEEVVDEEVVDEEEVVIEEETTKKTRRRRVGGKDFDPVEPAEAEEAEAEPQPEKKPKAAAQKRASSLEKALLSKVDREPRERKPINLKNARKQVRDTFTPLDIPRGRDVYEQFAEVYLDLGDILNEIRELLDEGQPDRALQILERVLEELDTRDDLLSEYVDTTSFWLRLDRLLCESVLSVELDITQSELLGSVLDHWQEKLEAVDIQALGASLYALEHGWDDDLLQDAMAGEFDEQGIWPGRRPRFANLLFKARLKVLEHLEEYDAALNLALAEKMNLHYLLLLIRIERFDEALAEAHLCIESAQHALLAAKELHKKGQLKSIRQIVELGKKAGGIGEEALNDWINESYCELSPETTSLDEACYAFEQMPSLSAFQIIEQKSGKRWSKLKPGLLKRLSQDMVRGKAHAQIYLLEGMVDEAIRVANDNVSSPEVVEIVVDAIWQQNPQWAIAAVKRQAEPLVESNRAEDYPLAITWLSKALAAAKLEKQMHHEFYTYINSLIAKKRRKHKLTPLLQQLISS